MSSNICRVCTNEIMQMCRKNTGICGEICQKVDEQPKVETHMPDEVREMHGFQIHDVSLHTHGLGTIEEVQPNAKMRPEGPCLVGWVKAQELEEAGRLLEGDVRRNANQTFDVWDGTSWSACEKPEKVA